MFASTHSAFAFVPANALAPPEEIARMKKEIADSPELSVNTSQRKQQKLLMEWFDDNTHPQIEIITYPVSS